jgi:hypothetical protein
LQNRRTPLTIEAVHGHILDPLEGTQTLFAHLAPVPATFHHGFASDLETAPNSGDPEFVEFLLLDSQMSLARLQLGLCSAELGRGGTD